MMITAQLITDIASSISSTPSSSQLADITASLIKPQKDVVMVCAFQEGGCVRGGRWASGPLHDVQAEEEHGTAEDAHQERTSIVPGAHARQADEQGAGEDVER